MLTIRKIAIGFAALAFVISVEAGVVDSDVPITSYVSFQSPNLLQPGDPLTISGQLRIPYAAEPIPAVVVLHGSAGLDSRGNLYIEALNDAGIATLEIDMWAARGLSGGGDRPPLPSFTVPDAFSALKYLAENPAIDANRIGVLGFSWGGVVTMLAATDYYTNENGEDLTFAAHIAHYPVCWAYTVGLPGIFFDNLTGSPVLIQIGDQDDYDNGPGPCEALAAPFTNVSVNVYKNSYHAWDRLQPAITVIDPFSHLGAGGEVEIVPSPGKAFQSRSNVVEFFEVELGIE